MATHDYVISNQSFPSTRTDINNVLQAIVTNNSNATAPSTTYASMLWYDTANDKFFVRNSDNDAWIELFKLDETGDHLEKIGNTINLDGAGNFGIGTTTEVFSVDTNGHATSKQNADVATAGGRFTGSSSRGACGAIHIEQTTTGADGGYMNFRTSASGSTTPTERMRIDSSGNVGIGTSSPSSFNGTAGQIVLAVGTTSGNNGVNVVSGTTSTGSYMFSDSGGNDRGGFTYFHTSDTMTVKTAGSEAIRLDSSGSLLVGATTFGGSGLSLSSPNFSGIISTFAGAGTGFQMRFGNVTNGVVGSITTTTSSTAFNTSSDYRLKENITDITDGITRLKLLNPSRFNFIADADRTVDGFIAHETATVVPEAVTGEKDAMMDEEYVATPATGEIYTLAQEATYDDDGNELTAATNEVIHSTDVEKPDTLEEGRFWRETTEAVMATRSVPSYQGIDQSKLVPLLTAALQEAVSKIEALETRVAALEA